MRKLNTSFISATTDLPIKSGTLDHIQLSWQEIATAIANNLLGAKSRGTGAFILFGCVNTGSGLNYIISAGAVLYSGEIYLVDAATFTAAGGQVAVGNIVITQHMTNADPVIFTDTVSHNVHDIRKMVFASGASGSGVVDHSNLKQAFLNQKNEQISSLPASYTVFFDQNRDVFFAAAPVDTTITFDFTDAIEGASLRLKWTYGAGRALSVNAPAGSTIIKDGGNLSSVASANNLLYIYYAGKNSAGNDEVSYTLKQY